ncbi:aldo/keto reductase [Streptomyces sp. NPDC050523]|uniref:aldo/keto reductase n=1 Tax=Streptomyces sp. NPDC050523 TaxID=3365622 RepID=UPI003797D19A
MRGWTPVTALQMEYSLLERTIEGELIPLAQDAGMGVLPWSPLKSGYLSDKYRRGQADPADVPPSALRRDRRGWPRDGPGCEQTAALNEVSAPRLNFPYELNQQVGPMRRPRGTRGRAAAERGSRNAARRPGYQGACRASVRRRQN